MSTWEPRPSLEADSYKITTAPSSFHEMAEKNIINCQFS